MTATTTPFCLTVRPYGSSGIQSLFAPRFRPAVIPSPPDSNVANRIYLPVSSIDEHLAVSRGAHRGTNGGIFVDTTLNKPLNNFDPWLPFYAKESIEPLNVDMIPQTNWGGSLANILVASSWSTLREPSIMQTNNKCSICGLVGHRKSIDCHEIWEYYRPLTGTEGVQKLVGIVPVCPSCHYMFHLGYAKTQNFLPKALSRLAWANRWTALETGTYYQYVGKKWDERNNFNWILDLSFLGSGTNLVLKGGKNGVWIDKDDDIHYVSSQGDGCTRFTGVSFTAGEKKYPIRQAPDYQQFKKDV